MTRAISIESRRSTNRSRRASASAASLLVLAMLAPGLGGCSTDSSARSVSAYCKTFYQRGTEFRSQFQGSGANGSQNPLKAIVSLITVPAQLADFFGALDKVAPPDIEPQVAQIQQAFQNEIDNATKDITNPVGGFIEGLASAIETGPAWNAVNNWTDANCGPPPGTKWLTN